MAPLRDHPGFAGLSSFFALFLQEVTYLDFVVLLPVYLWQHLVEGYRGFICFPTSIGYQDFSRSLLRWGLLSSCCSPMLFWIYAAVFPVLTFPGGTDCKLGRDDPPGFFTNYSGLIRLDCILGDDFHCSNGSGRNRSLEEGLPYHPAGFPYLPGWG